MLEGWLYLLVKKASWSCPTENIRQMQTMKSVTPPISTVMIIAFGTVRLGFVISASQIRLLA